MSKNPADKPSDDPLDPALSPTAHYDERNEYDEAAIKRARELLNAMPESVGPYRILERIGGGGMGEVYRAEQRSPIRRQVALKFIKLGMDSKAVLARFEAERQALALMDHPHIAKVFDAGTDDTGRPYFVMEYVKGKPITDYADRNQLTIRERLELFEQVCQAIQHAHHKGVIHRDLKPGNVLVSTQDDRPFAKVIDFGIAKAIAQRLTDETLFTQHDQFLGTPQYMSPEQAEGSVDIDTRTDVYSLGVLLYELLTGSTPFSTQDLRAAAFEQLKKLIIEVDPPKPSTRLTLNQPTLSTLAASRRTEPKRLGTLVQGELDWIVMKSLEKDRKRRYETPTSLANDIQAHLQGEPVQAAPPSTAYRIQKFVKKHKGQVVAVSAIAVTLLAGIAATSWQATVAQRNAIRLEEANASLTTRNRSAREALEEVLLAEIRDIPGSKLGESMAFKQEDGSFAGEVIATAVHPDDGPPTIKIVELGPDKQPADNGLVIRFLAREAHLRLYKLREQTTRSEQLLAQAEGALARGILRPIGFNTEGLDPAELKALADWSALENSRFQLMAFEVAFEDPTTALRVARRAERVIQSSVGLSPTRRAEAIELVSAKQRDRAADPRIRIAACWLALELGSADLPALEESVAWLSEFSPQDSKAPAECPTPEFFEFVRFAIARTDSRQQSEVNRRLLDPLLAVLEKPVDSFFLREAGRSLAALAPRLELAHVRHGGDALIALLEKTTDKFKLEATGNGLVALATRLEPAQVTRGWDALIAVLEKSSDSDVLSVAGNGLAVLAPRLEPVHVARVGDALIAFLEKSTDGHVLEAAGKGFAALAPRLKPAQVARGGDALIALLEKATYWFELEVAGNGLVTLAPQLEPAHVTRGWDALIAFLEKSTDAKDLHEAGNGLAALAPRLEPVQVVRGGDALIAILKESTDGDVLDAAGKAFAALAPRLEPDQIARGGDALIALLEKTMDGSLLVAAGNGLAALAPRLKPAQVTRGWDALIATLEKLMYWSASEAVANGLAALAPRLEPAQAMQSWNVLIAIFEKSSNWLVASAAGNGLAALAKRLGPVHVTQDWDVLITNFEKSTDRHVLSLAWNGLAAMATRLEPAQVTRSWDALIAVLEKSSDRHLLSVAGNGLAVLAPRLEPAHVARRAEALIAVLEESTNVDVQFAARNGLVALAPRLEPSARDRILTQAVTVILDRQSSLLDSPYSIGNDVSMDDEKVVRCADNPKSLGKLFSHPGCVGEPRKFLLQRFEELLFHDGKPAFLTKPESETEAQPSKQPKPEPPPRRFHNLHDAAAWIQQNWPDFDLETNHPVTWRGETK